MGRSARIARGLDVIASVLINKRGRQDRRSGACLPVLALKLEKRSQEPRHVGGL